MWAPGPRSRLLSRCGGIGKLRFSHTAADGSPSETLRKRLADLAKNRRKKESRKDKLFVETPRSLKWLDTPTVGMYLVCVGTGLFVKILMMISFRLISPRNRRGSRGGWRTNLLGQARYGCLPARSGIFNGKSGLALRLSLSIPALVLGLGPVIPSPWMT